MTNYLFDAKKAIEAVFPMIENIPAEKGDIAVGGGVVADEFFGKGAKDIDVFVTVKDAIRADKFAKYYGFEMYSAEKAFGTKRVDTGYFGRRRGADSKVTGVYKGFLLGYPVDIVVVNVEDVEDHIYQEFDSSVKACYYNGFGYFYSDAFKETVRTGEITPVRFDTAGYARAYMSAEKYGLKVSSQYDLSLDFLTYGHKKGMLPELMSENTFNQFKQYKYEDLFNRKHDKANVMLADLFRQHAHNMGDKEAAYLTKGLYSIADKKVTTHHPLSNAEFSIKLPDTNYTDFIVGLKCALANLGDDPFADKKPEETEAEKDFMKLLLSEEQFKAGKIMDESGREVKFGKYFKKICKKHHDAIEMRAAKGYLDKAIKAFEERGVVSKAKLFLTADKYALTHLSTNTEWTSCQRWDFGGGAIQNYGLLANVSGATLVGYFADERCDRKPSKWKGRILVRLGMDGSVFLERIYTTRSEYQQCYKSVVKAFEEAGHKVHTSPNSNFVGQDLWVEPYNDCGLRIAKLKSGGTILKGYGNVRSASRMRVHNALAQAVEVPFNDVFRNPDADLDGDPFGNDNGEIPF